MSDEKKGTEGVQQKYIEPGYQGYRMLAYPSVPLHAHFDFNLRHAFFAGVAFLQKFHSGLVVDVDGNLMKVPEDFGELIEKECEEFLEACGGIGVVSFGPGAQA